MALFELVELLDRHHVDRAEPLDLPLQLRDRFLGRVRAAGAGGSSASAARRRRPRVSALLALHRLVDRGERVFRRGLAGLAAAVWRHFRGDVVERHLQRFVARGGEMAEIGFRGRARHLEAAWLRPAPRRAHRAPRARRARCPGTPAAARRRGRRTPPTSRRSSSKATRSSSSRRRLSATACSRSSRRCSVRARSSPRAAIRVSSSRDASSSRRTSIASAEARSTSAAAAAFASAVARLGRRRASSRRATEHLLRRRQLRLGDLALLGQPADRLRAPRRRAHRAAGAPPRSDAARCAPSSSRRASRSSSSPVRATCSSCCRITFS